MSWCLIFMCQRTTVYVTQRHQEGSVRKIKETKVKAGTEGDELFYTDLTLGIIFLLNIERAEWYVWFLLKFGWKRREQESRLIKWVFFIIASSLLYQSPFNQNLEKEIPIEFRRLWLLPLPEESQISHLPLPLCATPFALHHKCTKDNVYLL